MGHNAEILSKIHAKKLTNIAKLTCCLHLWW